MQGSQAGISCQKRFEEHCVGRFFASLLPSECHLHKDAEFTTEKIEGFWTCIGQKAKYSMRKQLEPGTNTFCYSGSILSGSQSNLPDCCLVWRLAGLVAVLRELVRGKPRNTLDDIYGEFRSSELSRKCAS